MSIKLYMFIEENLKTMEKQSGKFYNYSQSHNPN